MLLLQTIIEYIKDNHPDWEANTGKENVGNIDKENTLVIQHGKHHGPSIWVFFYQNPPRISSPIYKGEYTENNVFQIITDIINTAKSTLKL